MFSAWGVDNNTIIIEIIIKTNILNNNFGLERHPNKNSNNNLIIKVIRAIYNIIISIIGIIIM